MRSNRFIKTRKGRLNGFDTNANYVVMGNFGLKSLSSARIKDCQLEAIRKYLIKNLKKTDKFWFRIFPFLSITSKPIETRMGKGKGSIAFYFFPLKAGRVLFEFQGISLKLAININTSVNSKLPIQTKIIKFYDF